MTDRRQVRDDHARAFQGAVGDLPVYNVAVPVLKSDFFVFELDAAGVRAA